MQVPSPLHGDEMAPKTHSWVCVSGFVGHVFLVGFYQWGNENVAFPTLNYLNYLKFRTGSEGSWLDIPYMITLVFQSIF